MNNIVNKNCVAVVEECTHGSNEGRLNFPQVIQQLTQEGIERYHADLNRGEKTYYMPDGTSHAVSDSRVIEKSAEIFSSEKIKDALTSIQSGSISYKEFCKRIANAGCTNYFVCLNGRRTIYFGRNGDSHTEWFPSTK
jgi:uncharacterized protein YbcV (DUF1398 family)